MVGYEASTDIQSDMCSLKLLVTQNYLGHFTLNNYHLLCYNVENLIFLDQVCNNMFHK